MHYFYIICLSFIIAQVFGCSGAFIEQEIEASGPAPAIGNLRFLGQSPKSAEVLIYSLDFVDNDGDLGDGEMEIYVGSDMLEGGPLSLRPIFLSSEIDPKAKKGSLQFIVQIFYADSNKPGQNFLFSVTVRVKDKAGHRSNTSKIQMRVDGYAT